MASYEGGGGGTVARVATCRGTTVVYIGHWTGDRVNIKLHRHAT